MPLTARDLDVMSIETDRLTRAMRPALVDAMERNRRLIESVMNPTFLRAVEDQRRFLLNVALRPLLADWERQRASLLAALQPVAARIDFVVNLPAMEVLRQSAQWQAAFAGVTESMVTDVLKTFKFTDPLADFRATLNVVLEQLAAEAEGMEDPGPLASPAFRARRAMRQAAVVIAFLLAGAAIQPPREAQDIPAYLLTVWSLVMLVAFLLDDE